MTWDGLNDDQRDHLRAISRAVAKNSCPLCGAAPGVNCDGAAGERGWPHDARTYVRAAES